MKNMFESKRFSIILIIILIILLIITGIVLLGNKEPEEVVQEPQGELDQEVKNEWVDTEYFEEDTDEGDEEYKESISKQYEEYHRVKKETNNNDSKGTESKKKDKKKTQKGKNNSGSGNKNSGNKGSNSTGKNNNTNKGSSNNSGGNGVVLPPINIGEGNPTVPKLPNSPKPENPSSGNSNDGGDVGDVIGGDDKDDKEPPKTDPDEGGGDTGIPPITDPGSGGVTPSDRPELDLTPHKPASEDTIRGKYGLSMITTNYGDGFRILPVGVDRHSSGTTATFEFYNTSKSPMTLTDENIYFSYDAGVDDLATSNLENSPLTIQPEELIELKVHTDYHEAALVDFYFRGMESAFDFSEGKPTIKDAKPLSSSDIYIMGEDTGEPYISLTSSGMAIGTKDFKIESSGIIPIKEKQLGPLKVGKYGTIGLINLRIANTGNKEFKIKEIVALSADYDSGKNTPVVFPLKDLALLEGIALPTSIKSGEIVEGYLPFYIKDGNHISTLNIETDTIDIGILSIESFNLLN